MLILARLTGGAKVTVAAIVSGVAVAGVGGTL